MPDLFSELKRIKAQLNGTKDGAGNSRRTEEESPGLAGVTPMRKQASTAVHSRVEPAPAPLNASLSRGLERYAPASPAQRQSPGAANLKVATGRPAKAYQVQARPLARATPPGYEKGDAASTPLKVIVPVTPRPDSAPVKRVEPVSTSFRPLPKGELTRQALYRPPEAWTSIGGRTQYVETGQAGAVDIVIGLDFGTSYTKAAVGFRDKIFPVTWEGVSLCVPSYLLPSEYTELDDGSVFIGQHTSARPNEIRADLKLPFINPAVSNASVGRASAFIALVLRYVRAWVFHHHGTKLGRAHLRWQLNIGAPSNGLESTPLVRAYRMLAATGWQRSLDSSPRRLAGEGSELWKEGDLLEDLVDLQVRPEFVAQMAGYMQSPQRQRGLHALVDVGGGTLDVVTFNVHQVEEEDTFPFLVPQVHALGTHGLIQNRLAGFESMRQEHAVDELAPIASALNFARATGLAAAHVAGRDALFKAELQKVIKGVLDTTKSRRYRLSDAWRTGVRTFFTGGGSRFDLYRDAVTTAKVPSANGLLLIPLPPHKNLDGFTGGPEEYQRISVACGLAQDAFTLGRIVPAKEVEDDRAVVPSGRAVRPDRDELYPR